MALTVVESRPLPEDLASGAPPGPIDVPGLIDQKADLHGVPRELVRSIALAESNFNPNAVSPKGATGVMQLMPATARSLGVTDIRDPEQNIDAGVRYLAQLSTKYGGDPKLVAAAYNAGPGAVDKYGGVPPFAETQKYVIRVQKNLLAQPAASEPTAAPAAPATAQAPATSAAAPAPPPVAGDPYSKIAAGEELTPELLQQIMRPQQPTPTPAAAPAPLSVVESRPLPPPPPPASIGDQLKSQGFLDSAWNAIKGQLSTIRDVFTGAYSQQTADQIKQFHELQKNGTPEQKREFAKQVVFSNIPFASTIFKATQGNLPGAAGDIVGMAALPVAAEAIPAAAGAVKTGAGIVADAARSPLTSDVVGVVSPRAANALRLTRRGLNTIDALKQAFAEAKAKAAAPIATTPTATAAETAAEAAASSPRVMSPADAAQLFPDAYGQPTVPPVQPRGFLPAAPNVIVPEAPPAPPDTSFVRAVPAQYPDVIPPHLRGNAPAETAAVSLRDLMRESGTAPPEAAAAPPEAPVAEASNQFEAYARTAKARRLAKVADDAGLTAQDAHDMITDEAARNNFALATHEDSVSPLTMRMIEDELRKLQPPKPRTARKPQ